MGALDLPVWTGESALLSGGDVAGEQRGMFALALLYTAAWMRGAWAYRLAPAWRR
ncbi:MAG: hypothetical protein J7603_10420 [Pseudacidovorax sp.]|nr:hypothetical protein [Pseudacidovorax sp.]